MPAMRIVLADDDVLLREGLSSLLERSGFDVVGQAGDGSELLRLVRELSPDLAIVDIGDPALEQVTDSFAAGEQLHGMVHLGVRREDEDSHVR